MKVSACHTKTDRSELMSQLQRAGVLNARALQQRAQSACNVVFWEILFLPPVLRFTDDIGDTAPRLPVV